jgi:hypothetical protein
VKCSNLDKIEDFTTTKDEIGQFATECDKTGKNNS